jgi:hypothetical protein
MARQAKLLHAQSGMIKTGYVGFSWTYLFFGCFVPLVRGEIGIAVLHLIISIFTFGFWQLFWCFFYNRQYMQRQLTTGWQLDPDQDYDDLVIAKAALGIKL